MLQPLAGLWWETLAGCDPKSLAGGCFLGSQNHWGGFFVPQNRGASPSPTYCGGDFCPKIVVLWVLPPKIVGVWVLSPRVVFRSPPRLLGVVFTP